jgi:hypothetical protein
MGIENWKALSRVSDAPGNEENIWNETLLRKDWKIGKKGKIEINVIKWGWGY